MCVCVCVCVCARVCACVCVLLYHLCEDLVAVCAVSALCCFPYLFPSSFFLHQLLPSVCVCVCVFIGVACWFLLQQRAAPDNHWLIITSCYITLISPLQCQTVTPQLVICWRSLFLQLQWIFSFGFWILNLFHTLSLNAQNSFKVKYRLPKENQLLVGFMTTFQDSLQTPTLCTQYFWYKNLALTSV